MAFSVTRMPLCFVKDNRSDLHHGVDRQIQKTNIWVDAAHLCHVALMGAWNIQFSYDSGSQLCKIEKAWFAHEASELIRNNVRKRNIEQKCPSKKL